MRRSVDPFDPNNLTPVASINRVRIVDLPGLHLDHEIKGKLAFELLGISALVAMIRGRSDELRLDEDESKDYASLPLRLEHLLLSPDPSVRDSAKDVASQFGRRLGYLLLTLKRGDRVNREARSDWDETHWNYWAAVQQVWLGGGIATGALGTELQASSNRVLMGAGVECPLRLSPFAPFLPLIGASRSLRDFRLPSLVADFGQTQIKLGIAYYENRFLSLLEVLPPIATPALVITPGQGETDLAATAENIVRLLALQWVEQAARVGQLATVLTLSVASYIRNNHPFPRPGGGPYQAFGSFTDNLGEWLSTRLSGRIGQRVAVDFVHDGTAAARNYTSEPRTAVILLGTALGIGFAPSDGTYIPISSDFAIRNL